MSAVACERRFRLFTSNENHDISFHSCSSQLCCVFFLSFFFSLYMFMSLFLFLFFSFISLSLTTGRQLFSYKVLNSSPSPAKSPLVGTPTECHYRGTLIDGKVALALAPVGLSPVSSQFLLLCVGSNLCFRFRMFLLKYPSQSIPLTPFGLSPPSFNSPSTSSLACVHFASSRSLTRPTSVAPPPLLRRTK